MSDIKESDWKVFKPLRKIALERFCKRVIDEVVRLGSDDTKSQHERYLAIARFVRERDKEIWPIFDVMRRSTALRQVRAFRNHDLLTEQELRQFSPEFVKSLEYGLEIFNLRMEVEDEKDA
jgi:hypothetical protein